MRLAWYAGTSSALAAGVVLSAFHQRTNFYSAMVYLFQSNLCLMILINLAILLYGSFVYGLQRLFFGQLRAIEVEQLYEKAWFAITETLLAMTIFRDDVGGSFIVMFILLLTGKIWGWIGEGRMEILEQQPPTNPRLFHARLSISLLVSLAYDFCMLRYAVSTVIEQARPDMMVMFLFEFAVLLVTSFHTAVRYGLVLFDTRIVHTQTRERLEERRRVIRAEREAILQRRVAGEEDDDRPLPEEDDVDEMDVEVPGWESKGQYILGLDLWTDFVKLCIYFVFFFVLLFFYGLPLHIIRDLFMTVRSFIKRLGALMKYRQAIRDMNKYADATENDLLRENTCIICREDMHVWDPVAPGSIERSRPKKLPCGHILHLGCLKSWMERQQVCPTCRRSVAIPIGRQPMPHEPNPNNPNNGDAAVFRLGPNLGGDGGAPGGQAGPGGNAAVGAGGLPNPVPAVGADGAPADGLHHGDDQQPQPPALAANHDPNAVGAGNAGGGAVRMFNFGPFRLGFARGNPQDVQNIMRRFGVPVPPAGAPGAPGADAAVQPRVDAGGAAAAAIPPAAPVGVHRGQPAATPMGLGSSSSLTSTKTLFADLQYIERRIEQGVLELQMASVEVELLRAMISELQRIRQGRAADVTVPPLANGAGHGHDRHQPQPPAIHLTADNSRQSMPADSPKLPAGVRIPAGWKLVPLQPVDGGGPSAADRPVRPTTIVESDSPDYESSDAATSASEAVEVPNRDRATQPNGCAQPRTAETYTAAYTEAEADEDCEEETSDVPPAAGPSSCT